MVVPVTHSHSECPVKMAHKVVGYEQYCAWVNSEGCCDFKEHCHPQI